jgi:hypothetical protein
MQFNLFGEDPVTTVTQTPLPWKTYFDTNYETLGKLPLDTDKRAAPGGGEEKEVYEDSMLVWKNEDWAVQLSEKEKKGENRNPWAGKNPCAVTKIGKKGISGTWTLYILVHQQWTLNPQEWLIHPMEGGYRSYRMTEWFDFSIHRKKSESLDLVK